MNIDAHQHFWQFDPVRDAWIDENMQVIKRDFMPSDLQPLLLENGIDGCVAVQADQSETETNFLLDLAAHNDFIKGVVGWVDLLSENLEDRLAYFSNNPAFKGVRHIAQAEAEDFLARKEVVAGISQLEQFNLSYDILVYAHQLPAAIDLVRSLPNQKFVIDHIAKPKISKGLDKDWVLNIEELTASENVYCKLSGMVTETDDFQWEHADIQSYLDIVVAAFGVDRLMYGSDWPVCLLAASYDEQIGIIKDYFSTFSEIEQSKIMGENAIRFYNLNTDISELS